MSFNEEFRTRTKQFAIRNIKLFRALPKTEEAKIIGRQLLRSATSVGANFRAATRARSRNEYYSKLSIVVEESDECMFWMELLTEAEIISFAKIKLLMTEATELTKVMATARKTIRFTTKK